MPLQTLLEDLMAVVRHPGIQGLTVVLLITGAQEAYQLVALRIFQVMAACGPRNGNALSCAIDLAPITALSFAQSNTTY